MESDLVLSCLSNSGRKPGQGRSGCAAHPGRKGGEYRVAYSHGISISGIYGGFRAEKRTTGHGKSTTGHGNCAPKWRIGGCPQGNRQSAPESNPHSHKKRQAVTVLPLSIREGAYETFPFCREKRKEITAEAAERRMESKPLLLFAPACCDYDLWFSCNVLN